MSNYHLRSGNTDLFSCEPAPAPAPAPALSTFPNSNCMQMQMQMQHCSNSSSSYADDQLLQNHHNLLHLQQTNNIYMESMNSSEFFDDPDHPCLFISLDLEHQQPFLFQTNHIPIPNPNPSINNDQQLVLSLRSHSQSQNPSSHPFHRPDDDHIHNNKSKYLQVLQLILSELTTYVLADTAPVHSKMLGGALDLEEEEAQAQALCVTPTRLQDVDVDVDANFVQQEINASRAQLLRLLQLVDNQYNKCMDEIQNMNSKFNAVSGNIVAPFAHLTISSLYKQLRKRITKEMVSLQKNYSRSRKDAAAFESSFIKHWASQKDMQLKSRTESHIWRPQRGLPEKSVSVLKAWLFQNFLRPYPSDNDKDALAVKSGLTRSQVSNWFINARVRLWKPMIEEMYAEVNKMKQNEEGSSATGLFV